MFRKSLLITIFLLLCNAMLAQQMRKVTDYSDTILSHYLKEGNRLMMVGDELSLSNALELYEKALDTAIAIKDSVGIARSLYRVGTIYDNTNKVDIAYKYYQKAFEVAKLQNDSAEIAVAAHALNIISRKANDFSNVFTYVKTAVDYNPDKKEPFNELKFRIEYARAVGEGLNGSISKAKYLFENILPLINKWNIPDKGKRVLNYAFYFERSKYFFSIRQFDLAIADLIKVRQFIASHELNNLIKYHSNMSAYYKAAGDYKNAYENESKLNVLMDKKKQDDGMKRIEQMKLNHELQERENELRLSKLKLEAEQQKLARQKITWYATATLLLVLLVGGGLLAKANNRINRKNKALQNSERDKSLLLKELNHRVKNNLQLLGSMLVLQLNRIENPVAYNAVNSFLGRVEAMAMVHNNLYFETNVQQDVNLKNYLTELVAYVVNSFKRGNVQLNIEVDSMEAQTEQAVSLGIIINELITNSLKYAVTDNYNLEISLSLKRNERSLMFTYTDNGPGMPPVVSGEKNTTFGLKLILIMLKELKGNHKQHNGKLSVDFPNFFRKWKKSK